MITDGGGWTLVTYAGTIKTTKIEVTGTPEGFHLPLIFSWGTIDPNSLTTKNSFSRFDLFKQKAKPTDEFMVKRTSVPSNIIIFPITNVEWFGRKVSEGHFNITSSNYNIKYLKMTNSGINNFKTVNNNVKFNYVNSTSNNAPGINWNVPDDENCDYCFDKIRSFDVALNHRSILYWEPYAINQNPPDQYTYIEDQWFHAQPLSLKQNSTLLGGHTPDNNVQDIEFWYRVR